MKYFLYLFGLIIILYSFQFHLSGCGQVLAPTGGLRDTIPPKLISSNPPERTTNFNGKKITLTFDEYIDLQQVQQNVIVSPTPKLNPNIDFKLKTVTIKLKDTLLPNTTYSINFGNSLKDLNEGNPFRKYTYVFSTGNYIDSLEYSGKVYLAENASPDSTLQVYLYKNAPDSAIQTRRPDYISNVDSSGNFSFSYLPYGTYNVYALKDGDGSKTYNSTSEVFAFLNKKVIMNNDTPDDTLYAYMEEKEKPKSTSTTIKAKPQKDVKLKITHPIENQDLVKPYTYEFNVPLRSFDKSKLQLTDTTYHPLPIDSLKIDSTNRMLSVYTHWDEDIYYRMIMAKDFAIDTLGNSLAKADTAKFKTKRKSEYGTLKLQFKNLKLSEHPLLQFVQNNTAVRSFPVTDLLWFKDLLTPAEYELRILYDTNMNGKWDPGSYKLKKQPEKVITIKRKITIRANFDSEFDIEL